MGKSKLFLCISLLMILTVFLSCDNKVYHKEYYENGTLKFKIPLKDGKWDGEGVEYFENGVVKIKSKYREGLVYDSVYKFHKNGLLFGKGKFCKNQKWSWWIHYDTLGKLVNKEQVFNKDGEIIINQGYYYNNGKLKDSVSHYFNIEIPESLYVGRNFGHLQLFSRWKSQGKRTDMIVVIENEYPNGEVIKDTFSSDDDYHSEFGIGFPSPGLKTVKGTIIEYMYDVKEYTKDSATLGIYTDKKYFEKEVFVYDTISSNVTITH